MNFLTLIDLESNFSSSKFDIFLIKDDFIPYGGSNDNFTLFYKTDIGNWSVGREVNHNRKSGCIFSYYNH